MKHLLYSEISPLHYKKLSIFKTISPIFIWISSHSFDIFNALIVLILGTIYPFKQFIYILWISSSRKQKILRPVVKSSHTTLFVLYWGPWTGLVGGKCFWSKLEQKPARIHLILGVTRNMWLKYKVQYVIQSKWLIKHMCYYLLVLNGFLSEFLMDNMLGVVWKCLLHPTHTFTLKLEQKYTSFSVLWPRHICNAHLEFLFHICG